MLAGLARMLAPGGLLSLLVRNADALAMRPGLRGRLGGRARAPSTRTRTPTGWACRSAPTGWRALTRTLDGIAAPLHAWYGVRVFTDSAPDERGAAAGGRAGAAAGGRGPGRAHRPLPPGGGAAAPVRRTGLRRGTRRTGEAAALAYGLGRGYPARGPGIRGGPARTPVPDRVHRQAVISDQRDTPAMDASLRPGRVRRAAWPLTAAVATAAAPAAAVRPAPARRPRRGVAERVREPVGPRSATAPAGPTASRATTSG